MFYACARGLLPFLHSVIFPPASISQAHRYATSLRVWTYSPSQSYNSCLELGTVFQPRQHHCSPKHTHLGVSKLIHKKKRITQKCAIVFTSMVFCTRESGQSRNFFPDTMPALLIRMLTSPTSFFTWKRREKSQPVVQQLKESKACFTFVYSKLVTFLVFNLFFSRNRCCRLTPVSSHAASRYLAAVQDNLSKIYQALLSQLKYRILVSLGSSGKATLTCTPILAR